MKILVGESARGVSMAGFCAGPAIGARLAAIQRFKVRLRQSGKDNRMVDHGGRPALGHVLHDRAGSPGFADTPDGLRARSGHTHQRDSKRSDGAAGRLQREVCWRGSGSDRRTRRCRIRRVSRNAARTRVLHGVARTASHGGLPKASRRAKS